MNSPTYDRKLLAVPKVGPAHYKTNFIQQVVCELRFPTLYDLDDNHPPLPFAKALRKDYPMHEHGSDVNLGVGGGSVGHSVVHTFRAKRWAITLRSSSLSLETSTYKSYAELREKLAQLVEAASQIIDSDIFTRVGLRYINSVPFAMENQSDWVNPALVQALSSGVYGDILEHSQKVAGQTDIGMYVFQHGATPVGHNRRYILDFDFSSEDVNVNSCLEVADRLHEHEFSMFKWALGEKAKTFLESSTANKP